MFPDAALFDFVLLDLADGLKANPTPPADPLPCDRWIARSALQKAIRRGEVALAQRALANLYGHDPRPIWRHLVIIAVEDVGVANVDLLAQIVGAQRDRSWRMSMGGDWPVMAELVRQMAESTHCQAACDLLLRASNDPALEPIREWALDASMATLTAAMADSALPLVDRGIAALAIGGGLAEGQPHSDPDAVFEIMAEAGSFSHVVVTCQQAWKVARNPMALLLPLVWQAWSSAGGPEIVKDDPMPAVQMIEAIPGYALDQFTRTGNQISRAYIAQDTQLQQLLAQAGIAKAAWPRTFGDVLFLIEGGATVRRLVWEQAEHLRHPYRWLPSAAAVGNSLQVILVHCQSKGDQIALARATLPVHQKANATSRVVCNTEKRKS